MGKFNGHKLKKLSDRLNAHQLEARQYKRQDRATFRDRVTKSFEVVGNGMQIFDIAIATTYGRFKRFVIISLAVWAVLVAYLVWLAHNAK